MSTVDLDLSNPGTDHTQRLVDELIRAGWRPRCIPQGGSLESNRQVIEFRTPTALRMVRFSMFTVGDRGEPHRRDERRIQITTTYQSGLPRLPGCTDIVLGYDAANRVYVGLDARRLEFGGDQHNASSSVDAVALEQVPQENILIRPHDTQIVGLEYQAIFHPSHLSEYVFNAELIHRGLYGGDVLFAGPPPLAGRPASWLRVPANEASGHALALVMQIALRPKKQVGESHISAYETGEWRVLADCSPEELEAVRRKCSEVGDRGEYFVVRYEKRRLRKAGKADLAKKLDWVSRRAVGKGYDIQSYETDGSERLIEVKSTNGSGMTFLMSDREWAVASRRKDSYYISRVVNTDREPALKRVIRNPAAAEVNKQIERTPAGWKIRLK